jgi:hypothetical protein
MCVCVPAVPLEQSGADAAVQAVGKSYKLSLRPSVAHTQAAAASRIDAKQSGGKGTGGASSLRAGRVDVVVISGGSS